MKNLDPRRARGIRLRMGLLCGVMALGLGGFVSSAYHVQVEEGASWRETAEKQRQRRLHIEPKRGTIYDRNGTPLAVSVEVPSVSADVAEMLHGVESAAAEADVLRDAAARLGQALCARPERALRAARDEAPLPVGQASNHERRGERRPRSRGREAAGTADSRPRHRRGRASLLSGPRARRPAPRVRRARRAGQGRPRALARRRAPRARRRGEGAARPRRSAPLLRRDVRTRRRCRGTT